MSAWALMMVQITVQSILTVVLVWLTLWLFHRLILRPWMEAKLKEIKVLGGDVDQKVASGVEEGIGRALRRLPESTIRGTTRQMIRMGNDLMEGGLSTLLGSPSDLKRPRRTGSDDGVR
ncbi:hypothetical protein [Mangrovitalea sediminis]|uniref:hypothetical protein n=1 Tax=Mangrovitalea sediminis TaxID=1982043 RepID=UPI000BE4BDF4|nr:hypothetical protein [Mangrovitalea sediminis]